MLELSLIVISFIALSGLLAMIDAAILSVTPAEVEVMVSKNRWGAKALRALLKKTTRAIVVIVVLTNVTNILGPILAGRRAEALFGSQSIGLITALLTVLTIVFSEVVPKSIGTSHAPVISRLSAPWIDALIVALYPVVIALERIVKIFRRGRRKVGTEEQIRALANLGGGAGHIDADERELIHRAFVLNDKTTRAVMTDASKICSLRKSTTVRRAAKMVFENHFSRYPVLSDSGAHGLGFVLSKDILESLTDGDDELPVAQIMRPVHTVAPDVRCDDLLNFLRKNHAHIALVATSSGIVGLVTLEDVLEELVGEIRDEGDGEESTI